MPRRSQRSQATRSQTRTLTAHVFRWSLDDCTGGGVSGQLDTLEVLCQPPGEEPPAPGPYGSVLLVEHCRTVIARPAHLPKDVQTCFGGNFLSSADSRLTRHAYDVWAASRQDHHSELQLGQLIQDPEVALVVRNLMRVIPIHDRVER